MENLIISILKKCGSLNMSKIAQEISKSDEGFMSSPNSIISLAETLTQMEKNNKLLKKSEDGQECYTLNET